MSKYLLTLAVEVLSMDTMFETNLDVLESRPSTVLDRHSRALAASLYSIIRSKRLFTPGRQRADDRVSSLASIGVDHWR